VLPKKEKLHNRINYCHNCDI